MKATRNSYLQHHWHSRIRVGDSSGDPIHSRVSGISHLKMRLYLTICLALTPVSGSNLLVFILAGQSNMEGHAEVATINKTSGSYFNGTLVRQWVVG